MCVFVSQINVMEFSQNIFFNSVPKRGSILYFDAAFCRPLVASFKSGLRLPQMRKLQERDQLKCFELSTGTNLHQSKKGGW